MKSLLSKLFARKPRSARKPRRLGVENLDQRVMPAAVTLHSGTVQIKTQAGEAAHVTVYNFPRGVTGGMYSGVTTQVRVESYVGGTFARSRWFDFDGATVKRLRFIGGDQDDRFINNTAINSVAFGNGGNDVLQGGYGVDRFEGGKGDDDVSGGWGNDDLSGREGNDSIWGDAGNDSLSGNDGNDALYGGDGDDHLRGGAGNDYHDGNRGFDVVEDTEGNNALMGGEEALPEAADAEARKWAVAFDFDTNSPYPSPAVSAEGEVNPGLKPTGSLTEHARLKEQLANSNTYHRSVTITQGSDVYTVHMYALYFRKDDGGKIPIINMQFGHRHDWEFALVWTKNGELTHASYSAHGDVITKAKSELNFDAGKQDTVKIVYHKDTASLKELGETIGANKVPGLLDILPDKKLLPTTHAFRFAKRDEQAENHSKQWVTPTLVDWERMQNGAVTNESLRRTFNTTDFGKANCPFNDKNFGKEIATDPPLGYPSPEDWFKAAGSQSSDWATAKVTLSGGTLNITTSPGEAARVRVETFVRTSSGTNSALAQVDIRVVDYSGGGYKVLGEYDYRTISRIQFTGGSKADTFINNTWIDSVANGNGGNDTLKGGRGVDVFDGGDGDDYLDGGDGNDTLRGRRGNDYLFGGYGLDKMEGNDGNDALVGGYGGEGDRMSGGDGRDFVTYALTY